MIDVVFLLLVFFLVTLKFREPEGRLQQDLPTQENPLQDPTEVEQVQITVERTGDDILIHVNNKTFQSFDVVEEHLRSLRERFERTQTEHLFILDASQDLPFQQVVNAIRTCLRADIPDIAFAPLPMEYFEKK